MINVFSDLNAKLPRDGDLYGVRSIGRIREEPIDEAELPREDRDLWTPESEFYLYHIHHERRLPWVPRTCQWWWGVAAGHQRVAA